MNLGTCCACGTAQDVRNILMLERKAPVPGTGWGCVLCGLPSDGAMAVLCDACLDAEAEVIWACKGYVNVGDRVPIAELQGPYVHDMAKHPGET